MIKVGIAGARGYTGRELVRYLLNHPQVEITRLWAHEIKPGGEVFSKICPEFKGLLDVKIKRFSTDEVKKLDVVFLALPHTVSMNYVPRIINKVRLVVDLSADYRLKDPLVYKKWYRVNHRDLKNLKRAVYGLTEINREKIKNAKLIANPGCYPSGIILALYPLMKAGLLRNVDILVDSKSGISGAGRKKDIGLLYAEVAENIKPYKVNGHQHIPEIVEVLQLKSREKFSFIPQVVPLIRGIINMVYIHFPKKPSKEIFTIYKNYYRLEKFIRIYRKREVPELKDVLYTNFCDLGYLDWLDGNTFLIISCVDNLGKGAAGQAVQNMNVALGLSETTGLI